MENNDNLPAHESRHQRVYVDDDELVARVLEVPEGYYECVIVNSSWSEKSLLEGDRILFDEAKTPDTGDIVLLEEEGRIRVGLIWLPGYLETPGGNRPLEPNERVIGVAVALVRRLGNRPPY
jgi:hypothetical protein